MRPQLFKVSAILEEVAVQLDVSLSKLADKRVLKFIQTLACHYEVDKKSSSFHKKYIYIQATTKDQKPY